MSNSSNIKKNSKILIIEPFYGGSHKNLLDNLLPSLGDYTLITLSAKKWHWRARCSALCLFNMIPRTLTSEKVLFCSSVLNLAELLGLRPDLQKLYKIIYFHENQLIYPVRNIKERDIQYALNEITSCIVADVVLFNSDYNKKSFVNNINTVIKMIPDFRPKDLKTLIEQKCEVLYFPVDFPIVKPSDRSKDILRLVWPHRWEFDKGPEDFFNVLFRLKENGHNFRLFVLGEHFKDNPKIFEEASDKLKLEIEHFGYVESKDKYYELLGKSHVVVSTAKHEFFGVAVLEAVHCGCYPLLPNDLVYPEIYPNHCLYENLDDLFKRLKVFCEFPEKALTAGRNLEINLQTYTKDELIPKYIEVFEKGFHK